MQFDKVWTAAALAVLAMAASASAAAPPPRTTIVDYTVTASNLVYSWGPIGGPAPVQPVTLDFTVELDPFARTPATAAGLTVTNFTLGESALFAYRPLASALTVGTAPGFDSIRPASNGFGLFILAPFTDHAFGSFFEMTATTETFYDQHATITSTVVQSAVPEPAAWSLILIGVAGVGASLRQRPRRAA